MLAKPDGPQIDKPALIRALPQIPGNDWEAIIQIIIQVVLALLENKEADEDDQDNEVDDAMERLRLIARQAALDTVPKNNLPGDLPHLIDAITATAHALPDPGFNTLREAREAMRLATNATLRDHAKGWHVWNTAVENALQVLHEEGFLENETHYRQAWLNIALALQQLQRVARK